MEKHERIRQRLAEIYGEEQGTANYDYIMQALERYHRDEEKTETAERNEGSASTAQAAGAGATEARPRKEARPTDNGLPIDRLAGKVFAICYPDNVYTDIDPTLQTLGQVLEKHFPDINGVHILPERLMSHEDLWPQDLHVLLPPDLACDLIGFLQKKGAITKDRTIEHDLKDADLAGALSSWHDEHATKIDIAKSEFLKTVTELVDSRRKSHFNDGGFSQISRAKVDPRFGDTKDLVELSGRFDLMLDYVVNHLDIDNETLEAFRRGENDGSAFIIISPEEYERRKKNGDVAKTFRPRPSPLFTGLRKYPQNGSRSDANDKNDMNAVFEDEGLPAPDPRITRFLSIYFKVQNGQGLTKEDRGIADDCIDYLSSQGIDTGRLFTESEIHEGQPALKNEAAAGMAEFCKLAGIGANYADVFERNDDEIYGEKFFIYTTFSESQADINPVSEAGFRLIVDDLFHLLKSGDLAMMRMDAIKYLWKEIGKRNFDMEEGNKLIEVIRLSISLAEPALIPLDEVNSSDQDVYRMGSDGGFYYLFGQVNAVPTAFNTGSLRPLERLTSTMADQCPDDLLLFVMLSTHDGRSVQGIGVDRPDGHVSIHAFSQLRKGIQAGGGKVKYRSVSPGVIPAETLKKACSELKIGTETFDDLFYRDGDEYRLKNQNLRVSEFREAVRSIAGDAAGEENLIAVTDFLTNWVISGRAAYELCCTTRSAFDPAGSNGRPLTPADEARRMALAQVFVLSFGQSVPAIYFNDLLGLINDTEGYERSGRPRDLNRHKSHVDELNHALTNDEFTKTYVSILNKVIHVRSADTSFQPNSRGYEFHTPAEKIFLNHAYAGRNHSLVIGNIENKDTRVHINLCELEETGDIREMTDRLTGTGYSCDGGALNLEVPAYGALWLSASS